MSKLMENATTLLELVERHGRECVIAHSYKGAKKAYEVCAERRDGVLAEIRAAVTELERDAARYRYLREFNGRCPIKGGGRWCEPTVQFTAILEMDVREHGEDKCIDAGIDSAMEEE